MQAIEQFMHEYFRDRTGLLEESIEGWETHVRRFFTPDYQPYDRKKGIADSEAERIISVSRDDGLAEIITTGFAGGRWRFRYRLSAVDERWGITSMQMECGICQGSGKRKDGESDCKLCKGVGWNLIGEKINS